MRWRLALPFVSSWKAKSCHLFPSATATLPVQTHDFESLPAWPPGSDRCPPAKDAVPCLGLSLVEMTVRPCLMRLHADGSLATGDEAIVTRKCESAQNYSRTLGEYGRWRDKNRSGCDETEEMRNRASASATLPMLQMMPERGDRNGPFRKLSSCAIENEG